MSKILGIKVVTESEVSETFLQGMASRMDVSYHKYGPVMQAKGKADPIASLELRLKKYRDTGNTEWLMDVANFAMIEYLHKGPESFRATDSNESPGIVFNNGVISDQPHTPTAPQIAMAHEEFYKNRKGD